jgi:hypothetical protein
MKLIVCLFLLIITISCDSPEPLNSWFKDVVLINDLLKKINIENWNNKTNISKGLHQFEKEQLKSKLIPRNEQIFNPRKKFIQFLNNSVNKQLKVRGLVIKENISEGAKISTKYILCIVGIDSSEVNYYRLSDEWYLEKSIKIPNIKIFQNINETLYGKDSNSIQWGNVYSLSIFTTKIEYTTIHFDNNFYMD